jgi:hypothetical protein
MLNKSLIIINKFILKWYDFSYLKTKNHQKFAYINSARKLMEIPYLKKSIGMFARECLHDSIGKDVLYC